MKDSEIVEKSSSEFAPENSNEIVDQPDTVETSNVLNEGNSDAGTSVSVSHGQENEIPEEVNIEVQSCSVEPVGSNANVSTSESIVDGVPVSDSKRKFRVLGLNFPGKWMETDSFIEILRKSETFHLWFEKASEGKVKPGGASIVFESIAEAKNAFAEVQKMKIDGCSLKLQASKLFYEEAPTSIVAQVPEKIIMPFDVEAAQADTTYRLYAIHLHSSTKQDLLTSIFDPEYVKTIKLAIDPYAPSEMQAEIVFSSKEEADTARSELDELEIEELDRMVLLSTEEYISYMKKAGVESAISHARVLLPTTSANSAVSVPQPIVPHMPAPDLTVDNVAEFLQKHLEETRTNWAELNEVMELWKLCDDVSRIYNGIPDSLLKFALLNVLENHRNALQNHWMRSHLEELIKLWKKEVQATKSVPREGAVELSAPTYSPTESGRRKGRRSKTELSILNSVGPLLNTARTVMAVEEGELVVDRDDHGIFSIDGHELTFENWGKICNASSAKQERNQTLPAPIKPEFRKLRYQYRKEMREKKMEDEKIRIMQESMRPLEEKEEEEEEEKQHLTVQGIPKEKAAEASKSTKKRELEEGEMSSESYSSSSSQSSVEEETLPTRRRWKKRQHKKHESTSQFPGAAANPQFMQILTQLYGARRVLMKSLSPVQKHAFASILNQIASSPQGMTSAQKTQMTLFMRNHAKDAFPSK